MGIKEILIVSGTEHAGHFSEFLGDGSRFGVNLTYKVQEKPNGIAGALALAEDFANKKPITVILGDNIFEQEFSKHANFSWGARIFLKRVADPERFGVAKLKGKRVIELVEKPKPKKLKMMKSRWAVTGIYQYDEVVFNIIRKLKPSKRRGELEITDVNMAYLKLDMLNAEKVTGFWSDAGTHESLHRASCWAEKQARNKKRKNKG